MSDAEKRCYRCDRSLGIPATPAGSLADDYGVCALCMTELAAEVGKIGAENQPLPTPDTHGR